jgi:hypothetical protein
MSEKHREDVLREERFLAELKERRTQDLERQLQNAAGEQRMSVLLQLAELGSAGAVQLIDRNLDSISDRLTLLNAAASGGHLEARPLLLRAVRTWGPGAGHPIERLHYVFGAEIAPELRARLAGAPDAAVRRAIRTELVRLNDRRAIAELGLDIANARVGSREDAERAIDLLSLAMGSVALSGDVGRLFRRVDATRSDAHRQLKQYAAGVALWLGDRESAGHVIDLLASPGSDYFDYPGLRSLVEILRTHTKQTFPRPEEWKAWWASSGRSTALFTVHVSPEDEARIITGAVRWGRDPSSGPFIRDDVVYLQVQSKYLSGREEFRARLDPDVRPHTATEISLLGKNRYTVTEIEANGEKAFAVLGDGSAPMAWRLKKIQLAKLNDEWRVVSAGDRTP